MDLDTGLVRDIFTEDVDEMVIDDKDVHREVMNYLRAISPELRGRVRLYKGRSPIFDYFGIEAQIEKTFERKVWLKKGGYIVIQGTEAMVTIDVNTGRFTGKRSQEDTILQTNLDAAREVARQLRLRDLGGIVVIDFIDMEEEPNRRALVEAFRSALQGDRARTKIHPLSELCLMEMTRQRVREPLLHYFSEDCPACGGTGKTRSLPAVGMRLERSLRRVGARSKEREVQLWVNPDLAVWLFDERGNRLEGLEHRYGFTVDIQEDPRLRRDEFRIVFPRSKRDVTSEFEG
jgi:ribonuclease G